MIAPFFAPPSVDVERRSDGSVVMRSSQPLGAYPGSLGVFLRRWARERPDTTFLGERTPDGWRTVSYAEMLDAVRRLAARFLEQGLGPHTPIAILSENSIAHATVSLSALYVGIPVAPISPAYSTLYGDLRRLRFVLDALQPALVFAADADRYHEALAAVDHGTTLVFERGASPRDGAVRLGELLARDAGVAVDAAHEAVGPDDIAKILFTSGSTGDPKGVVNTNRMLCSNQQSETQLFPFLDAHDIVLVDWLPWHHTFGGNHNFNMILAHGGTMYIDEGRPMPGLFERSIANLAEHPPSLYFNVPRGHKLLVDALAADDAFARRFFSRLRVIANAAAALPRTTWDALLALNDRYSSQGISMTAAWGLTETAPLATLVHYDASDPADIGLPGPGTELLFVPYEHKLEVRVRGPLVTPGYWRRDDLTASAFDAEGFYRTGDAVRFADPADPAKGLRFDGRIAENFKLSSGTWVDAGSVRLDVLTAAGALIDDVVVAGENRDELGLLLFAGVRGRARFADDDALRCAVTDLLAAYNVGAGGSSHHCARAVLVFEPLSPVEGEITDKGSVNQRRVLTRRAAVVDRLFADPPAADTIVMPPPAAARDAAR